MENLRFWRKDFLSSLVVFLVALPLCLGIALASNAPLSSGLYAGIIGGIVIGFFSGSGVSVSGPAAGLTVIVVNSIETLGSFEAFTLAVVLSGILQIVFGFFKGGRIGDYFPSSVIRGMLAAIGIILIMKQIPHAIGNTEASFYHQGILLVSLISIGMMLLWEKLAKTKKFFQLVPGPLVAVVLSIFLGTALSQTGFAIPQEFFVQLPFSGGVDAFFGGMTSPDWTKVIEPKILTIAVTLALVGSLESLLSIEAGDKIDPQGRKTNKNKELLAQGVGNTLSGLIGGLPITAVIVRTSANVAAGAKTKLSAILHGVWLFLCVVSIPHVLNLIPLGALASVLLLVGYKLTKPALFKEIYAKGMNQFLPFVVTILAILATDLLVGILIGMTVGFMFVLRTSTSQSIVIVNEENRYLLRFHKDVSFLHKERLNEAFAVIPEKSYVIIDGSAQVDVDQDIEELIREFVKKCQLSGGIVELKKSRMALCPLFREE